MSGKILSGVRSVLDRISITVKMMAVTIIVGITIWAAADYTQQRALRQTFQQEQIEHLREIARKNRMHFDQYVRAFNQSVRLFTTGERFRKYIASDALWSDASSAPVFHRRVPPWLPGSSVLRVFPRPRYALLLDSGGRPLEIYKSRKGPMPQELLEPGILLHMSYDQGLLAILDDMPWLIISRSVSTEGGEKVSLELASPMDREFLHAFLSPLTSGHIMALLGGDDPRILSSSDPERLPPGTRLADLRDNYLVTGNEFFDYGTSEIAVKLAFFVSVDEVEKLTSTALSRARQQRALFALAIILAFAVIMYFIAQNIRQLTKHVIDFEEKHLGIRESVVMKGDEMHLLRERFYHLTKEVIRAHKTIRSQAEGRTRLIVNNAFDAIITTDSRGNIETWNPRAEAIFGWKLEEAEGRKIFDTIISSGLREKHVSGLKNFAKTGMSRVLNMQFESMALHRDGHEFPVELSVSPAQSGESHIFIAIIRDITERKMAEEKIKTSLREKELLLREIHHRVKNNMQVIISMINLQTRHAPDSSSVEMLNDSRNRIKAMSLIHEKLYRSSDIEHIDSRSYINELTRGLLMSCGPDKGRIALKTDIEEIPITIDTAIPCGLLINELVSNAMKHAFPDGKRGEIRVSLRKILDLKTKDPAVQSEIELSVSDNGVGIPEGLDFRNTGSLGLQLVTTLSEDQLEGKIEVSRSRGTEFRIRFREVKYKERI